MNIVLARLDLPDRLVDLAADVPVDLFVEQKDTMIWVGIRDDNRLSRLNALYAIMKWASQFTLAQESKLVWTFSSVELEIGTLPALLDRWDETGEPPLFSIVALKPGERRHVTWGLADLVGFELAVRFGASSQSHDAARQLTRLARHVLMTGGIARDATYEALDGSKLHLEWTPDSGSTRLITIVL
jgi:hypothetical protein